MTIFRISFVRISEIEMKTKKGKDMTCEEVLEWLAAHANPEFREGMVRFGIDARLAGGGSICGVWRGRSAGIMRWRWNSTAGRCTKGGSWRR